MKRFLIWFLGIFILVGIAGFFLYKFYLPEIVASALVTDDQPAYVPKFVTARIEKYKTPVNNAAADVIDEMHRADVTLDQIFAAIDNTDEEQVQLMMDELNQTEIKSTNQVFDIGKKYFTADFDLEVLRKPFNENVSVRMIKDGLKRANNLGERPVDPDVAKEIVKQILRQKEKEYQRAMGRE